MEKKTNKPKLEIFNFLKNQLYQGDENSSSNPTIFISAMKTVRNPTIFMKNAKKQKNE